MQKNFKILKNVILKIFISVLSQLLTTIFEFFKSKFLYKFLICSIIYSKLLCFFLAINANSIKKKFQNSLINNNYQKHFVFVDFVNTIKY